MEAHGEPLSKFTTYSNMVPAKVVEVSGRSFKAELADGEVVTVPWSGMSWAKEYLDANRIRRYPNSASDLVKKDDIVRLIANENKTAWRLTQIPKVQGSLVALDPETGAVEALVGGFDFRYSKFNRATQGWRQPGSTIKPLNYAAALEKAIVPTV
nr:penicillin-binding transpeptidase domain-containing protein [Psychrobacter sp. PraFG1]UNK05731.1 penicillin-binding transpeptidase domain-containing protein [Psychrobacter sp. PraFG1]